MKTKPSRISRITVARLYNTGNYEHVRYELTAEVPRGGSAKETFKDLVLTLRALKPISKPCGLDSARAAMAKRPEERSNYEKDNLESFGNLIREYEALKAARMTAVEHMDQIGGTSLVRKPSQKDWDQDCPF